MMRLGIVTYIEAAHRVGDGPLHGHNFKVEVIVEGEYAGGKMDFHTLREIVENVVKELDHRYLNEIIDIPVVENIARYIANKLKGKLPVVVIRVWETPNRFCELVVKNE